MASNSGLCSNLLGDHHSSNRPVGRAVTRSSLEQKVRGLNLGPVKSYTVLPTAHDHCDIP